MKKIYFEIEYHNGGIIGDNSRYSFDTLDEAVNVALEFKRNPKKNNPRMTDENVLYWKSQTFSVKKITVVSEIMQVV